MPKSIANLIICNPYKEPIKHWEYNDQRHEFEIVEKRRPAGFITHTSTDGQFNQHEEFVEIKLATIIREKIKKWRKSGRPGITSVTRMLMEHWENENRRDKRLFFCQLEAIESVIWLCEASGSERNKIDIPSDGGDFDRLCCKMATGTGKTIVMGMLIAWQVINAVTNPDDDRFSRNVLVVAPGLTVKSRLQVLYPNNQGNVYDEFGLVPGQLYNKIFKGAVVVTNWHRLQPEVDPPYSVTKLGTETDGVFANRIFGQTDGKIVVINDEAHHAYRTSNTAKIGGRNARSLDRDRLWVEGLDRIHRSRGVSTCYDFSATPFVSTGKGASSDDLFGWIVSDFSLNDAIESGLVKTPQIAIKDDSSVLSKDGKSRLNHIYMDEEVKHDLMGDAGPSKQLPDLVRNAYMLLGRDWKKTKEVWDKAGSDVPPVIITVCNKTGTAARIVNAFKSNDFGINELGNEDRLLHIDSAVLKKAETRNVSGSHDQAEVLRKMVDTVGKKGKIGAKIMNIVAVQMLSEGWDARTVTHIMGLRAFTSQLLCEQVIGRGLRRTSYEVDPETGLLQPEYVTVFGVPFTYLPHEIRKGTPPHPTTPIEPDIAKVNHKMSWPNVERIDMDIEPCLQIDWDTVEPLILKSTKVITVADVAKVVGGETDEKNTTTVDMKDAESQIRLQRVVFTAARAIYHDLKPNWNGNKDILIMQVIKITEKFMERCLVTVPDAAGSPLREKITVMFNMAKVVAHICRAITDASAESRRLRLNLINTTGSTSDMKQWYTSKHTSYAHKTHINLAVYDDTSWEITAGYALEKSDDVISWAKNDHLGFSVKYIYNGILHDYYPDFLIALKNGVTLVLEIKGRDSAKNKAKREAMEEWVNAVNLDGRFGIWAHDVAFDPTAVLNIIKKHITTGNRLQLYARCPACNKVATVVAEVVNLFGFRNLDGFVKPQSWCKQCRISAPKKHKKHQKR